ncbi:MAG: hypothetical protein GX112_02140 [Clostridiaceae bacterium]|jgi:uncharacterized membrane protein YedE/YeeE|nr:hypothetical protein [Clostridiaceae bacterium]
MSEFLEAVMVISFGVSWPLSIRKSWVSRTARGKSLIFMVLIFFGYISGILSKITALVIDGKPITYVFAFYVLNAVMVAIDIVLYFRNKKLDAIAAGQEL